MLYFTISLTKALRLKVWVLPRNHKYLLKYSYIAFLWTGLIFTSWSFLTAVHDFYAKVSWNFAGLFGGQFPLIPRKIHCYWVLSKNHKCLLKEVFESNLLRRRSVDMVLPVYPLLSRYFICSWTIVKFCRLPSKSTFFILSGHLQSVHIANWLV